MTSCQDFPRLFEEKQRAQRIELLEEDNKELRERERNLKRVSEEFARMLDSLQSETENLRAKLRESDKQLRDCSSMLQATTGENRELKKRIDQLMGVQATMCRDNDAGSLRAEFDKTKLRQEIQALKKELQSHRSRQALMESIKEREHTLKMKQMEHTLAAASTERRLKEEQRFHEQTVKKYELQLKRLESRADQLQQKRIDKENELATVFTDLKELEIENGSLRKQLEVSQAATQQQREKAGSRYKAELQALKKETEGLRQQLKLKEVESRASHYESRKNLLTERTKNTLLREAASKLKENYQQKSSLIIRQLLSKEEKISTLKKELSRSQSRVSSNLATEESLRGSVASPKILRLCGSSENSTDNSTIHSSQVSEVMKEKVARQLFRSRQNHQVQFTIEKNDKKQFQRRR